MIHHSTDEQLKFLKKNRPLLTMEKLIFRFNKKFNLSCNANQIAGVCQRNGFKAITNTGAYSKGAIPWNKGRKGYPSHSPLTTFKKGVSFGLKDIGSERINSDGYVLIKTACRPIGQNNFEPKHRVVWRSYHGAIPPNHVIIFKDNNFMNFNIDNLVCVSRQEFMILNRSGFKKEHPELKETILLVVKLQIKLSGLTK